KLATVVQKKKGKLATSSCGLRSHDTASTVTYRRLCFPTKHRQYRHKLIYRGRPDGGERRKMKRTVKRTQRRSLGRSSMISSHQPSYLLLDLQYELNNHQLQILSLNTRWLLLIEINGWFDMKKLVENRLSRS
ncbi:hypothetical protein M8C21_013977, partial [Ambrosia artemisiifolia]